jgi:carotenoid 1,2-hydratase
VVKGGYRWWYVDALSEDGRLGFTVIAFIGSVFSPYYALTGWSDPHDHCTINVALYGDGWRKWAMTERGRGAVRQEAVSLSVGSSALAWEDGVLVIRLEEITAPIPSRISGVIRLHPRAMIKETFRLDHAGRHLWRPFAPRADVEVALTHPAWAWRGQGYFDSNMGAEPLETAFAAWQWSRAHRPKDTLVFYDVKQRDGAAASLALTIANSGAVDVGEAPPSAFLAPTFWGMTRSLPSEGGEPPRLKRTLEDAPFYARSMLEGRYGAEPAHIVHESLSLDRLRSPLVKAILPFRMPRRRL